MIDDNRPLLVPMALDALVVTREARTSQNFQRWQMTYSSLDSFQSPEPAPFSGLEEFSTHPEKEGVYLLWTLPAALRHGTQTDPSSGAVTFPLVPNRWLVVRYSGPSDRRVATAWV